MLGTVLMVLLILMLIGALPTWPHSKGWGVCPDRRTGPGPDDSGRPDFAGQNVSRFGATLPAIIGS